MITWHETRSRLRADRVRLEEHFDALPGLRPEFLWLQPSYQCVVLHRLSFFFYSRGNRLLARLFWHLNLLLTACDISPISDIGGGLVVNFPLAVGVIGSVGKNCTIEGHGGIGGGTRDHRDVGAGPGLPLVGDDVVIGWGAMVLGPVRIGHRVSIGYGAVVIEDVADDEIIPARELVRRRSRARA